MLETASFISDNGHEVNLDNGVVEFLAVPVPKQKFKAPFFLSFLQAQRDIGHMRLPGRVLSVYLCLLGELRYENYVSISQKKLAESLKMSQSDISKCLKMLVDKGILEVLGFKNGTKCFRLSPTIGWRGKVNKIKRYKL